MAASGVEKSSKKKTEKKLAAREEAKLLAGFMGVMNNMRKQDNENLDDKSSSICTQKHSYKNLRALLGDIISLFILFTMSRVFLALCPFFTSVGQKALMIFTFIVQGFQAQLENISLLGSPLPGESLLQLGWQYYCNMTSAYCHHDTTCVLNGRVQRHILKEDVIVLKFPFEKRKDLGDLIIRKTLCDVILMVQERKIPAHRVVLAAASHFFNLMFTTNMLESKSFEVELKDAEPDIIEQLVEFAYTARISVNSNNVQSLLDAANQYQIEPVKKMCVDFLKEQVDASNCLGISVLAECLDCPELKATADDFIHQHFTEVYKTDEFLQLDVKRVTHLLNQDTLTVRAEDQVYDAAVRWLKYDEPNRQPFMVDILAKVRFPLISKNFLSKTVQAEPLIQDNPECLKMVITSCPFLLQDYSWTDIRCPFEKRRDAACVFWDNVVYILGGSQLFPIKRMDCYNVVKDSWYSKLGPPTPRDSLAACAAEGKIYTSGGSEVGNSALYLFECYDTRTESWHTKPSMLTQRCSHGMVEANGLIYVCGGSLGNNVSGRVLNSCEVYDPATETWTELCPMIEARKNHGLVFVKDKIFAVGGQNSLGGLDNVEYYDIKLNEWKMVSPMPWKGVTVKCAAVGSIVYVLAGFQGVGRLGHILEYNTETDKWVANSKVRAFPVTSCLICVVDTCGANEETLET
ncbi:Kelch-like protein 7 [Camelus dromedarius]|uniref:Kelch-like protein 7 n=1 Tax=Camelus dromedarius TaxID=9838 RepID=A0A5N4DZN3_CAMDR|nr:Kelch-like protein 7 [Camelus dromedarius]KAB1276507.1 Kelch-like protein 7 [Camelus dromedarius]